MTALTQFALKPPWRAQIDSLVGQQLQCLFPCCSLVVVHRGDTVLERAWGVGDDIPARTDWLFDLASITKLFTSTLCLQMASSGRLSLDQPLCEVLNEFSHFGPRSIGAGQDPHTLEPLPAPAKTSEDKVDPTTVTFRHLLTHTSGLAAWRALFLSVGSVAPVLDHDARDGYTVDRPMALRTLCSYPFISHPGARSVYSDVGFMLLGEALARLGGKPLDILIREYVLAPLNAQRTQFGPLLHGIPRSAIAATEYDIRWRKRRVWGEVHDENAFALGGVAGHAGLFATAADVARFGQAWMTNPAGIFGLDPNLAAMATQEQVRNGGTRRGLGFMIKALEDASCGDLFSFQSYGHTGYTGTSLWIDPQRQLVVACLTNSVYRGRDMSKLPIFRRALHDLVTQSCRL